MCFNNTNVDVFQILKEALEGVNHLHDLQPPIVHRDITPRNVLICISNNKPRGLIADLGLGKKLKPHHQEYSVSITDGSTGWMAPELIKLIRMPNIVETFPVTPITKFMKMTEKSSAILVRQRPLCWLMIRSRIVSLFEKCFSLWASLL